MIMINKIITVFLCVFLAILLSGSVFATMLTSKPSGVYFEGNGGFGLTNVEIKNQSTTNTGFTGNIAVGYKFNQYIGTEVGGALFPNVKAAGKDQVTQNYSTDLVLKLMSPLFNSSFEMFSKLGIAMVHSKWNKDIDSSAAGKSYFKPAMYLGLGIGYYFTPHLATNLQIMATTKNGDEVPAMYAGTVGLTYII